MALDLKGNTGLSKNKYVHMLVCMLALLFCVLATRPFVSMGVNDDLALYLECSGFWPTPTA